MENIKSLNSENIRIFTTEEVIQNQVKNLIHNLMDEGKASPTLGWAMSDILEEVRERVGVHAVSEARRYIVKDICKRSS